MPLAHQSYWAHAISHTRTPFQTYIGTEAEKVKQNQTALNWKSQRKSLKKNNETEINNLPDKELKALVRKNVNWIKGKNQMYTVKILTKNQKIYKDH